MIAFTGDGSFMINPQILIDAAAHGVRGIATAVEALAPPVETFRSGRDGHLARFLVEPEQKVERGQPVALLNNPELWAAVGEARAGLVDLAW
jgi:hypothetical protein